MICQECIEAVKVWQAANEDLCRITTILTAYATGGDQLKFDEYSIRAEDARLRAENARTALDLNRNTHDLIPAALQALSRNVDLSKPLDGSVGAGRGRMRSVASVSAAILHEEAPPRRSPSLADANGTV
jgi:hypothetical protein